MNALPEYHEDCGGIPFPAEPARLNATAMRDPRNLDLPGGTEEHFYSSYAWCLNPLLSVRELFQHLDEELDRYAHLQLTWQRQECVLNLYLFVCAIACTADDYLAWRPWNLSVLSDYVPRLHRAVEAIQWFLNMPYVLHRLARDRSLVRWRRKWDDCVDRVCDLLVTQSNLDIQQWADLQRQLHTLTNFRPPPQLRQWRMRIPEGFRDQDLTHYDVLSLVQRFLASSPDSQGPCVIIGPRTAGAYFAPLVKAYLSASGWPRVSWMSLRPKTGLSLWERDRLHKLVSRAACVLLVDDHPNTGLTFDLLLTLLRRCGVQAEQITILVPRHPVRPDWRLPEETTRGVKIFTLEPSEIYKEGRLHPRTIEPLLREYLADGDRRNFRLQESAEVDAINQRLQQHYQDGFHVRVKRVFAVQHATNTQDSAVTHVIAKSVGWGWLGYHAYLAGTRLTGFVPPVLGLRNGMLFTKWVGGFDQSSKWGADCDALQVLSSYVARRVQSLRLAEDPCFFTRGRHWGGWDELVQLLRGVYGPYVGRCKTPVLQKQLQSYRSPFATLIDGQMRGEEWLEVNPGSIYKGDFEQHNFGGGELDVVDPAYDLAAAIFEFQLSAQAEQTLLQAYAGASGDHTISERILLYKLLYGNQLMKRAARKLAAEPSRQKQEEWHALYLAARNFLTFHFNRYCASFTMSVPQAAWSKQLFFLDLDGVFDCELLGFPHTTLSGLVAIRLLQSCGFSIVLNTARSVEHVRQYCQTYTFPGGIAEHGSVFVDAVRQRELPLIEAEAVEQLAHCRNALKELPGVFLDPAYQYSVRAYRYSEQHTVGLRAQEVEDILRRYQCDRLQVIAKSHYTDVVQKETNKGSGLLAAKRYLGCTDEPVVAIGDSELDVEMLALAESSYAPANCARQVRELAHRAKCRIMPQPFQRGFLAAVHDVLRRRLPTSNRCLLQSPQTQTTSDLLRRLLGVADRPRVWQLLAVLTWWSL